MPSSNDRESPYRDLDRPPLSERRLHDALVVPGGLWVGLTVRPEVGSTNAEVAELARGGAAEGEIVVA